MKKTRTVISILLCVALLISVAGIFVGCNKNKENVLKLYSQGEYMDEEIFAEFEAYYMNKTGKEIEVTMEDFDSNEQMYSIIAQDRADYDLICPSEYMIEKMIKDGLVQKVDKSVINVEDEGLFVDEFLSMAKVVDPSLDYIVPFMFGTYGIMYNTVALGGYDVAPSIELLYNSDFKGKKTTKASIRDTYTASLIYAHKAELDALGDRTTADYKTAIQAIFDDTSTANMDKAFRAMETQEANLNKYDNEDGKFSMARDTNGTDIALGLYWSCDAGYVMNEFEDDDGVAGTGNKNLWYEIPEEGGNVYIDGFVISKYAQNTEAANMFLEFLCRKEIAVQNSKYIGAVSTVKSAYDALKTEYSDMPIGEGLYTFPNSAHFTPEYKQAWKDMYLEMVFPSIDTLNRCAMFRAYPQAVENEMKKRALDVSSELG